MLWVRQQHGTGIKTVKGHHDSALVLVELPAMEILLANSSEPLQKLVNT